MKIVGRDVDSFFSAQQVYILGVRQPTSGERQRTQTAPPPRHGVEAAQRHHVRGIVLG